MQVILLERIARLGHMGQTVEVKPGFARNYLLPQKKALRATSANLSLFEAQRAKLEADNATRKAEAEKLAASMEGLKLTILRQAGEAGHLFGSVSARDIADAAKEAGHSIARSQVAMHHPIKTLGIFTEEVQLHPEVSIKVSVNIARNADEAKIQEKTGKAFLSAIAAEEDAKRSRAASKAADAAANAAEDAAAEEAQVPAAEA